MKKIKILVVGHGNVALGAIARMPMFPDLEIVGIVTRRVEEVKKFCYRWPIYDLADEAAWSKCPADVVLLCGGSATDLPVQGPLFAKYFNTVDSFDTHGHIGPYKDPDTGENMPGYFKMMDDAAEEGCNTAIISVGWDPGLFSLNRALIAACMPEAKPYAFYGLTEKGGLSMGHSDAIRRIEGVKDALSFTHANHGAITSVCGGGNPVIPVTSRHWRECLVVLDDEVDSAAIEKAIQEMPEYFLGYETNVTFVTQEELNQHRSMTHDGMVLGVGDLGAIEFRNEWTSNPMATASIMLAYARAAYRKADYGETGAFTVLSIQPGDLLPEGTDLLALV